MHVRVAEAMPHLTWSAIEALGKRAATYALSCPTHLSTAESAILGCADGADAASAIAYAERASMGDALSARISFPRSSDTRRPTSLRVKKTSFCSEQIQETDRYNNKAQQSRSVHLFHIVDVLKRIIVDVFKRIAVR